MKTAITIIFILLLSLCPVWATGIGNLEATVAPPTTTSAGQPPATTSPTTSSYGDSKAQKWAKENSQAEAQKVKANDQKSTEAQKVKANDQKSTEAQKVKVVTTKTDPVKVVGELKKGNPSFVGVYTDGKGNTQAKAYYNTPKPAPQTVVPPTPQPQEDTWVVVLVIAIIAAIVVAIVVAIVAAVAII